MKVLLNHSYLLLISSCILAAFAQLSIKAGASTLTGWQDLLNPKILLGIALYALGMLLWIFALARSDLHVAYAFTALTFILVISGSSIFLGEKINLQSYIGVILITAGFIVISLAGQK